MKVKLALPLLAIATLVLADRTAQAGVTFYDVFKNDLYSQNSNAQPSIADGFFATASLSYETAGDVGNVQVVTGGNTSPLTLSAPGLPSSASNSGPRLASPRGAQSPNRPASPSP
jgi:hypothetical protein